MATYISRAGNPHYSFRVQVNEKTITLQFENGVIDNVDEAVEKAVDALCETNRVVARNVRKVDRASIEAEARRLKAAQKIPNAMKGGLTSAVPEKDAAAPENNALKLMMAGAMPVEAEKVALAIKVAKVQ